jgi:hypothetical protein
MLREAPLIAPAAKHEDWATREGNSPKMRLLSVLFAQFFIAPVFLPIF